GYRKEESEAEGSWTASTYYRDSAVLLSAELALLGVNPLRLPLIRVLGDNPVVAILPLFLLDALLTLFALLKTVAHDCFLLFVSSVLLAPILDGPGPVLVMAIRTRRIQNIGGFNDVVHVLRLCGFVSCLSALAEFIHKPRPVRFPHRNVHPVATLAAGGHQEIRRVNQHQRAVLHCLPVPEDTCERIGRRRWFRRPFDFRGVLSLRGKNHVRMDKEKPPHQLVEVR